ncbi:MAG: hypothetical protein ACLU1U_00660 [Lachnospiraceae bacterium]
MTKYSHQNAVDLFVRMVQVDSPSFSESAMVDFIENEVKTLGWDCKILRQRINMRDLEDDVKERLPADELEKETEQIQIVMKPTKRAKTRLRFLCRASTRWNPAKASSPSLPTTAKSLRRHYRARKRRQIGSCRHHGCR